MSAHTGTHAIPHTCQALRAHTHLNPRRAWWPRGTRQARWTSNPFTALKPEHPVKSGQRGLRTPESQGIWLPALVLSWPDEHVSLSTKPPPPFSSLLYGERQNLLRPTSPQGCPWDWLVDGWMCLIYITLITCRVCGL